MARFSVVIGLLLCGLTVYGMVGSTQGKMATAFVPMMFGIPLVICGVVALNPHRRRLWMAMAAAIGACGLTGAAARASFQMGEIVQGEATNLLGLRVVVWMSLLCAVFVGVYIIAALHRMGRKTAVKTGGEPSGDEGPVALGADSGQAPREPATADQRGVESPQGADDRKTGAARPDARDGREPAEDEAPPVRVPGNSDYSPLPAGRSVDKRGQLHRI